PGCLLRDLLEHRRSTGTFADDPDRYVDNVISVIAEGNTWGQLMELPDGRTISVVNHPMAGGGWVATHEDITERTRAEKQIAHMARHDALTDLPNRVLLRERLAQALDDLAEGERLAVLYLDLDHFKSVNDTLGHQIGNDPLDLLKNADMALYRAKADGRGTYRFFEPEMDARMKSRRSLELALRKALANGEFELHYQPLVSLDDRRITGCEALLRWQHPE